MCKEPDELDEKAVSWDEAVTEAASKGIADPEVTCHIHGVTRKVSELSPMALLAAQEGIDTLEDMECLLLSKV